MGLFDMFAAKPEAAPAPVAPGNLPEGNLELPTPVNPEETPASPLDGYKDLWDTDPSKAAEAPAPNLDPDKLKELVNKADFSQGMPADLTAAIAAGGEGAEQAFGQAMNHVAQQVMVQSTLANEKMIDQAVKQAIATQQATIPDIIKKQQLNENLRATNPIYANPAVVPVMEAVQSQLAAKNPAATAAELSDMSQDFVKAMFAELNPSTSEVPADNANAGQDWSSFLSISN